MCELTDEQMAAVKEIASQAKLPEKEVVDAAKTLIFCGEDISGLPAFLEIPQDNK